MFGGLKLLVNGEDITSNVPKKTLLLIARLAIFPDGTMPRTSLACDLFPDSDQELRQSYLRQNLSRAHKILDAVPELLSSQRTGPIRLNVDRTLVDVATFDLTIDAQDLTSVQSGVDTYIGPLLAGYKEPWVLVEREKRRRAYLRAIGRLRSQAFSESRHGRVVELSRIALANDPLSDAELRALMEALANNGEIPVALAEYQRFEKAVRKAQNRAPEAETRELLREMSVGRWILTPSAESATVDSGGPISSFPSALTPIVGRERDLSRLRDLLSGGLNRLVTITATGGVGKTRLALHVAKECEHLFNGSVYFADLASITNPLHIKAEIQDAVSAPNLPGTSWLTSVKARIGTARTLLILDNCEHLRDACAHTVNTLLQMIPSLVILATSRRALGVTGERLFRLATLATPDRDRDFQIQNELDAQKWLAAYPAAALFVQRAEARGSYLFSYQTIPAVTSIIARLDGIALAIELAAARTNIYSVQDLAEKLEHNFDLLQSEDSTLSIRQRTVDEMVRWSTSMLSEQETRILKMAAVFRGSWSFEIAEKVFCGAGIDPDRLPSLLGGLVDATLIQIEPSDSDSRRFRLFEVIRIYADVKLSVPEIAANDSISDARERYIDAFTHFAAERKIRLIGSEQLTGFSELDRERENLRHATELALAGRDPKRALELIDSLWNYWAHRNSAHDCLAWYEQALNAIDEQTLDLNTRLNAYNHAGNVALLSHQYEKARMYFERYLAANSSLASSNDVALATGSLALVLEYEGKYEEALVLLENATEKLRSLDGASFNEAVLVGNAASCHLGLGNYAEAAELYRKCIALHKKSVVPLRLCKALCGYAESLAMIGEISEAVGILQEAASCLNQIMSTGHIAECILAGLHVCERAGKEHEAAILLGMLAHVANRNPRAINKAGRVAQQRIESKAIQACKGDFNPQFVHGFQLTCEEMVGYLTGWSI